MLELDDIVVVIGNGERNSGYDIIHHHFPIGTVCKVVEEECADAVRLEATEGPKIGMWQYVNTWDVSTENPYKSNSQAIGLLRNN